MKLAAFALATILSSYAFAHESTTETHSDGEESGLIGSVELRPSWEAGTGNMFGENTLEMGYQFTPTFQLGYGQEFHHNIRSIGESEEGDGLGLHLETGILKSHFHNILQSEHSSFSFEPRIYMPTSAEDRDKGFQTALGTKFILAREVSEEVTVSLSDAPIFFAYSAAGIAAAEHGAGEGETEEEPAGETHAEANPSFQNITQFALSASLFSRKLTVTLPFQLYLTKHSNFNPVAEHNDSWTTILSVAPEIAYEVSPGFSTGLAMISPNLLNSELSDHSVNHGRTTAVTQLVVRASL